jgi:hypothetical protein
MTNEQSNFDKQFLSGSLSYESYRGPQQQYLGSQFQSEQYKKIYSEDVRYRQYISNTYGTYENYLTQTRLASKGSVFNPLVDFPMDVTVLTKDTYYKSDHISGNEIIMEALNGICSFSYIKKNGSSGKTNGTLDVNYIPQYQQKYRANFFSVLPGSKITVWDIYKQRWNTIFLKNMLKFVRDDTTDLE